MMHSTILAAATYHVVDQEGSFKGPLSVTGFMFVRINCSSKSASTLQGSIMPLQLLVSV